MDRPLKKTPVVKAAAIAGVSVLFGVLFDVFFFEKIPGISFPLYIAGLAAGIVGLAHYFGEKPSKAAWWLLLPLVGFASMVAVRASESLTFMNVCASVLLLLLIAKVAFRRRLNDLRVGDYLRLPFLPLQFFEPLGATARQLVAGRTMVKTHPHTSRVVRGIVITLPVLAVFIMLFASADLIFQKYVTSLIDIQINPEFVGRTVLVLLASAALMGAYSYIFSRTKPEATGTEMSARSSLGKVESSILFGSVNVLFLLFILVQFAYLFGGESNIIGQGFTYAEYARKGFFELLAVALVAFGLLWAVERRSEKTAQGHTMLFKTLSLVLIAQVVVVMGSAFWRLYLYEEAYGFTELRLYSHMFTVFLAVIFGLLAYKIIRAASDQAFAFPALLVGLGFLAILNMLNPDAFIARQNLDRYKQTGKVDAYYLSRLSADAAPVVVEAYSSVKLEDSAVLGRGLNDMRREATGTAWQSWNASRSSAVSLIDSRFNN